MPSFQIADCPTTLALAPARAAPVPGVGATGSASVGSMTFTVRNATDRARTARIGVLPDVPAVLPWFTIEGAPATANAMLELDFEPRATQSVRLRVAVPAGTAAGQRLFRVRATAEEDVDNDFVDSGSIGYAVPPPPPPTDPVKRRFPWWIAAVAALLLIVVGAAAWLLVPSGQARPDLVGKTEAQARDLLVTAGYAPERIASGPGEPAGQPPGSVARAEYGDAGAVRLVLDPGARVPALSGLPVDEARRQLEAAHLQVGPTTEERVRGAPGSILRSDPPADSVVASGTPVALAVVVTLPYGADTCRQGFVWRDAGSADHVCVTPETRSQAAADNAQADARREPGGGPYGPNTCRQGFVWREAFAGDFVCVVPDERAKSAADNGQAAARREIP